MSNTTTYTFTKAPKVPSYTWLGIRNLGCRDEKLSRIWQREVQHRGLHDVIREYILVYVDSDFNQILLTAASDFYVDMLSSMSGGYCGPWTRTWNISPSRNRIPEKSILESWTLATPNKTNKVKLESRGSAARHPWAGENDTAGQWWSVITCRRTWQTPAV